MKKINLLKIFIFFTTAFMLLQDRIVEFIKIDILNYLDEILVIILFILSIINIMAKKKIKKISVQLIIYLIIFFITGTISCYLNSNFSIKAILLSGFISIKFWLLIFSLININVDNKIIKYFKKSLEIICLINIIVSILNFILPDLYNSIFKVELVHRFGIISITGLFDYPVKSGWFMLFMTIYYYSKIKINNKNKNDKKMLILCAIISLLSLRTKVILGFIIILFVEMILNKKINIKKTIVIFITIILTATLCKNIILNTYKLYFNFNNEEEARVILTNRGMYIMKEYFPLGVGFGKYGSYYARINYSEYYYRFGFDKVYGLTPDKSNYSTDTFWPSIMGETGITGLIIYMLMIGLIFRHSLKIYKINNYNNLGTWALLAFIQSICESFGEQSFNSPPQNIFLAFTVGITLNNYFKRVGVKNEKIYTKRNNVVR